MKFEEVLPTLREGKKIRRKEIVWQNYYGFLFVSEAENEILSDNARNCDYKITKDDLNADDWEIVKKSKKVKLRDLTEEQYSSRLKNYCNLHCKYCRFKTVLCNYQYERCWLNHKDLYSDKFLDQEIEVEE